MNATRMFFLVVALLLALVASPASAKNRHASVSDLGVITTRDPAYITSSYATSINDRGQILINNFEPDGDGPLENLIWRDGHMTVLPRTGHYYVSANVINNAGIVGGSGAREDVGVEHPVLWRHGERPIELPTLGPDSEGSVSDINASGLAVGWSETDRPYGGPSHAVLWLDGRLKDLGTLGGSTSAATAVNNRGHVVGYSTLHSGAAHAFVWKNGSMRDLGTLGGDSSRAVDVNERGQVIGVSTTSTGVEHGFLWKRGTMRDLGPFQPVAINNRSQIVGYVQSSAGRTPAYWHKGGITDLPIPNDAVERPWVTDINNRGQAVGFGTILDEKCIVVDNCRHILLWRLR